MRTEVTRFGGTVEQILGDTLIAMFGVPAVHEDDPERAVRAALAIRESLGDEVELRSAVHTAHTLVTPGADATTGTTLLGGDIVTTAGQLVAHCHVDGIIVGESTFQATAHAIAYRALNPIVLRGRGDRAAVWTADGLLTELVPRHHTAALVGRKRELDQLDGALARAMAERSPQLVTVLGPPGIGKTRLVEEVRHRQGSSSTATWLTGRSLAYGDGVTSWALGAIVKERAGILEGDPAGTADEKLRRVVEEALGASGDVEWVLRHRAPAGRPAQ